MIGKTVHQYHILSKLGSGGMGVVYKAKDLKLDRFVALKFLSEEFSSDPQSLERFQREARAVAALDHPSICTIHDIGEHEGRPFIVMQLLDGHTLKERIVQRPLKLEEIFDFGIQIADGLEKAHSKGIIHRDIKPANIFITTDGHAKLLDFGLAKAGVLRKWDGSALPTFNEGSLTNPGTMVGTFGYMSPEQAHGEELDARADLFSFGAVLYEMTTGQAAFAGKTNLSVLDGILNKTPASVARLNPEAPVRLEEIISKALEKSRETRYQSAAEIRADLRRLKRDTESLHAVESSGLRARPSRPWIKFAALGGVLAIALAALIVWRSGGDRESAPRDLSTNVRLTRFMASAQGVFNPSLSSDGKIIAFVEQGAAQLDLFVSRTAGGGRVQVTNDAAAESDPRISPDGERILYTRLVPGSDLPEICISPTFGGGVTPLIRGGSNPAWSPDGSRFVFISRQPGEELALAIADINGQNPRTILQADATYIGLQDPAWSPDGSQIVVVRSIGGVTGEIWSVPVAGGAPVRLWNDPPEVFSHDPVFTSDGRAIIHSSNRGGATNIWMLFLDGTPPARLTSGAGPDEFPSVANDGTIAFVNARNRWVLTVTDTATGMTRELLSHASFLWGPAFSPDGRDIAVNRAEPDGSWRIWMVPTDGGPGTRLTSGSFPEIYPRFTRDGNWVVYSGWSNAADRIWKIPRAGGVPVPISPVRDDDDAYADVSPDGEWMAFARTEGNTTRVYVAPFEGGEARLLTKSPSTVPRWSPDGRSIAFSPERFYNGGIFVISADGSNQRQLTQQGGWPVWWPDGKRIAYLAIGPDGNQQVRIVPLDGGPSSLLPGLRFLGTNFPIDLDDKGRLATTNMVHLNTEIWLASQQ